MSSKRRSDRYDLAVIGAGTAGLIASRLAAALGARVVLIERGRPGGDCLWTGCVPSKALIAAANLAHQMRTAGSVGLCRVEPEIDFARVMAHVHGARSRIEPKDSADSLRADRVAVIEGSARFVGPGRIDVDGTVVRYRSALIATGSGPMIPDLDGLDDANPLTTETLWDLTELPGRLAILGGGPIGCELGQAFQRLGSQVTMVQRADWVLSKEEPETQQLIAAALRADGVDVRLGASAQRVDGSKVLVVEQAGAERRIEFDRILVAAGRRPDTDGLGLESIGAQVDARGAVKVNDRLATTAKGVYAAGDAVGALPFTHVAGYHGRTVVTNALFHGRSKVSYNAVPWATFTDPEVGRVGLTEAQARDRYGDKAVAVVYDYQLSDRAVTAGDTRGFAKLVGDPKGKLVGATVTAAHGGESIAELAAWIRIGAKIDDVSNTVHAYPTFTEGQARAADDYLMAKHLTPSVLRITKPVLAVLRRSPGP